MWNEDDASRVSAWRSCDQAGEATLTMTILPHMVNGHGIAHGGFIFLLADFGLRLCLQFPQRARVAAQCNISFIRPGKLAIG